MIFGEKKPTQNAILLYYLTKGEHSRLLSPFPNPYICLAPNMFQKRNNLYKNCNFLCRNIL